MIRLRAMVAQFVKEHRPCFNGRLGIAQGATYSTNPENGTIVGYNHPGATTVRYNALTKNGIQALVPVSQVAFRFPKTHERTMLVDSTFCRVCGCSNNIRPGGKWKRSLKRHRSFDTRDGMEYSQSKQTNTANILDAKRCAVTTLIAME
jgi:hypothetical protein